MIAVRHTGDRTLVFGVGIDLEPVAVRAGGRERRVRPVGLGAFVVVFDGAGADGRVKVRAQIRGRPSLRTFG